MEGGKRQQLEKLRAAHVGAAGPRQPGVFLKCSRLHREDAGALGWQPSRTQVTGAGGCLQASPVTLLLLQLYLEQSNCFGVTGVP